MSKVEAPDGSYGIVQQPQDRDKSQQRKKRQPQDQESASDLHQALAELREAIESVDVDLNFRLDQSLGIVILTIRDPDGSERVLRRVPTDEVLRLARYIKTGRQKILDRLA